MINLATEEAMLLHMH